MPDDKLPPGVSVQHFTKEQRDAGLIPGVSKQTPEHVIISQGETAPPPASTALGSGVPESSDAISESAPPSPDNVQNLETGTPDNISSGEVVVRGNAAIAMAEMLGLAEVWDARTGGIMPLVEARKLPQFALIDFEALKQSINGVDENTLPQLLDAMPEKFAELANQRSQNAFVQPPPGPGISVRHIPGLIRVEVEGPVKLTKSRQGNVRMLSVQYSQVQAPAIGNAKRVTVGPSPVSPGQTHKVQTRIIKPTVTRTVPRIPPPTQPEPEPEIEAKSNDYEDNEEF